MKTRESRKPLTIPAQIRTDGAAVNVTIRNVSSQGMMISGAVLPPPGSYVEVIRGSLALAGRVVWTAADLCGVRTHARIDDVLLKRGRFTAPQAGRPRVSVSGVSHPVSSSPLLREQRSSALLRELQHVHCNLIDAISTLEVLLSREDVDRRSFADVRLRLMKASGEKLKLIETVIYPHLQHGLADFDNALLNRMRSESFSLRGESTTHVAAWSPDRILENRAGYSQASAEIRTAMRRRIEREKAVLYPLLQKASAGSATPSFSWEPYRKAC